MQTEKPVSGQQSSAPSTTQQTTAPADPKTQAGAAQSNQPQQGQKDPNAEAKMKQLIDAVAQCCNAPSKGQSPPQSIAKNLPFLIKEMAANGLTSKNQMIAMVATVYVETGSFEPIEEGEPSRYTSPIGDPRFWGRGYIQTTHESNYKAFSEWAKVDAVSNPDLLLQPEIAAKAALFYWLGKAGNEAVATFAEKGDFENVRSCVNAGSSGLFSRTTASGTEPFLWCVNKGKEVIPFGAEPGLVGVVPVAANFGAGDFDTGGAGMSSVVGIGNVTSQQDALAMALGLHALNRTKLNEFRAIIDLREFPEALKFDVQKTFELKGIGEDYDGTYTIEELIYHFPSMEIEIYAHKPDPNAKTEVMLGSNAPSPAQGAKNTPASTVTATGAAGTQIKSGLKVSSTGWAWPMVVEGNSSCGAVCEFGTARGRMHNGLDIGGFGDDTVWSAKDGVVTSRTEDINSGEGRMFVIDHPDGTASVYMHMNEMHVTQGQSVKQGQVIGTRGGSGLGGMGKQIDGGGYDIHLHFETHVGGAPVDPRSVLPQPQI